MKLGSALPCLLLASCLSATAAPSPSEEIEALLGPPLESGPLTAEQRDFLCAVLPDHLDKLGGDEGPAVDYEQVRAREETVRWRDMPRLECPPGTRTIFWHSRFVDAFGLSPDARFAALSGGWQAGPLSGAGGICYFERSDEGWQLIGCMSQWVS